MSEWIRFTDQFPKEDEEVLFSVTSCGDLRVGVFKTDKNVHPELRWMVDYCYNEDEGEDTSIYPDDLLYWMRIPELPSELIEAQISSERIRIASQGGIPRVWVSKDEIRKLYPSPESPKDDL